MEETPQQDFNKKLEDARERGKFEGQVLQSLSDIKQSLDDMKNKQAQQDIKLGTKADKEEMNDIRRDVNDVKKKVWFMSGAAALIGFVLSKLI